MCVCVYVCVKVWLGCCPRLAVEGGCECVHVCEGECEGVTMVLPKLPKVGDGGRMYVYMCEGVRV